MNKRRYRNQLPFIESAFRACWGTAQEHVAAAKVLIDTGHHAQALSLSVLAIEELGKLFCVDGLLFARPDDERAKTFARSLKDHETKLSALVIFPILLENIASVDPRFGSEARFGQAIAISLIDLKNRGNEVLEALKDDGFRGLNVLKQKGFYSTMVSNTFERPSASISASFAEAVYALAWRASSTLDFVLKGGNLERYLEDAKAARAKLTEADFELLTRRAEQVIEGIFPDATGGDKSGDSRIN
jgi:AbiV family abortive infection protein